VYGDFSRLVGVTVSLSPLVCAPVVAASPSMVTCVAPPSVGGGFVALSVGSSAGSQLVVDGAWSGEALQFEYVVPGSVLSAWPRPVPWRGGDVLWLSSTGVRPDASLGGCVLGGSAAGPAAVAMSSALVACELPGLVGGGGDALLTVAPSSGQVEPASTVRVALMEALSFTSVTPSALSDAGGTRIELEGVNVGDVTDASCWLGTLGPLSGLWSGGGRLSCLSPAVRGAQPAGSVLYGVGVGPTKHSTGGVQQSVFQAAVGADVAVWPPTIATPQGGAVSLLGWDAFIDHVWPGFASAGGGSAVVVYGDFSRLVGVTVSLSPLVCAPVVAASPSMVTCVAPPSVGGGFVALSVGSSAGSQLVVDGAWSGEALQFEYVVPGSVLSAWPRPVPWRGGDVLWLSSTGVRPDASLGGCVLGGSAAGPAAVAMSSALVACELPGLVGGGGDALLTVAPSSGQVEPASTVRVALMEALSFTSVTPSALSDAGGTRIELEGVNVGDVTDASCWLGTLGPLSGLWSGGGRLSCLSPAVRGAQPAGSVLYGVGVGPTKHSTGGVQQSVFQAAVGADVAVWPPTIATPQGGAVSLLGWDGALAGVAVSCNLGGGDARVSGSVSLSPWGGVQCLLPAHAPGFTALSLLDASGSLVAGSQSEVLYVAAPLVSRAQPSGVWSSGGALVALTGTGLQPGASPACLFGVRPVGGVFVSTVLVVCESPAGEADTVEVGVPGALGQGASVELWPGGAVVVSSSPDAGSVVGGTAVSVLGSGFPGRGGLECWFGSIRVSAAWLSGGGVQCTSPAGASSGSTVPVLVGAAGGDQFADGSGAFTYSSGSFGQSVAASAGSLSVGDLLSCPAGLGGLSCMSGPPGFAVVRLGSATGVPASSGLDDVYSDAVLELRLPARVLGCSPGRSPVFGGAVVTVLGAGFGLGWQSGSGSDACLFGAGVSTAGAVVSSALLLCEAPANVALGGALSVALGTQSSAGGSASATVLFAYDPASVIVSASPSGGSPSGGSVVRLSGGEFPNTDSLRILFGSLGPVLGVWRSGTEADATSPASAPGRDLPLAVSASVARSSFEFGRLAVTFTVSDTGGPAAPPFVVASQDGPQLILAGVLSFKFVDTSCQFGAYGPRTRVSSYPGGYVSCMLPGLLPGFTTLTLADARNGDWLTAPVEVGQAQPAMALAILPSVAVGGALLRLTGTGLSLDLGIAAGGTAAPTGTLVSSAVAIFEAPCVASAEMLAASTRVSIAAASPRSLFDSSALAPVNTTLGTELVYVPLPVVSAVLPEKGPSRGGSVVKITGAGFSSASDTGCLVGSIRVAAQWASDADVRCVIPARAPGDARLSVGVGAADWAAPLYFTYYR
jgi:hypothetical protein